MSVRAGTPARYAELMIDANITAWIIVFLIIASVSLPGYLSSSILSQTAFAPPDMVDATVDMAPTWDQSSACACSKVCVAISAPPASTAACKQAIGT